MIAFGVGSVFSLGVLYMGLASLYAAFGPSPGGPRTSFALFGAATTVLSLWNLSIVLRAWRSAKPRLPRAAAFVGAAIVIVACIASLDSRGIDGLEFAAIVGLLAAPAVINWYVVRILSHHAAA